MEYITNLVLTFIIYTIVGYISEVIGCIVSKHKLCLFRGFLIGPWIPIYGGGALLMILCLSSIKNYVLIFFGSMILCSTLEYITSYLMEKKYHMRWWDYSDYKINLNGRICLTNCLLFGVGGVIVCGFANPILQSYIKMIPFNVRFSITAVLAVLFITDVIVSGRIVSKLKKNADNYSKEDSSEKIKAEILLEVSKHINLYTRVLRAYPNLLKYNQFNEFNKYVLVIKTGFKKFGNSFKSQIVNSYLSKKLIKELNTIIKDFNEEYNNVKDEYEFVSEEVKGLKSKILHPITSKRNK